MKVLVLHNRYQHSGGEDAALERETRLLVEHGHAVVEYRRDNDELHNQRGLASIRTGIGAVWASQSCREVAKLIAKEKPDVAHFHNTFPLISPSAYYACAEAGVPVVQTLHNYRLLCPAATFLRGGKVCQACLGRSVAWPAMLHGCYRGSRPATAAVAAMLAVHRAGGTWREKVDVYVALSEFARRKFVEGGLPAERIVVKPNFVEPDPGLKQGPGGYALFVGRLSEEKGLRVLLNAWGRLREPIPLRIAGEGPLRDEIAGEIQNRGLENVALLGRLSRSEITSLLQGARFLVLPSICYENFPLTAAEAFASGLSVIASRLGAMEEIIEDGVTGVHFSSGDPEDLVRRVEWAWAHPNEWCEMGRAARTEYEKKYTGRRNYERTMQIYAQAVERSGARRSRGIREQAVYRGGG